MKKRIIAIIAIVLGLLAAIGPRTIFPVCNGAMKMRCYNTAQAELVVGLLAVVLGTGLAFLTNKKLSVILSVIEGILGLFIVLIPTVIIGVCGSPMMHCVSVTNPALIVTGILEIVTGVALTFFSVTEKKTKSDQRAVEFANH